MSRLSINQSTKRTKERIERTARERPVARRNETNPPPRARARVGVYRRNVRRETGFAVSAHPLTVYTYTQCSGFFSRVFEVKLGNSVTTKRTNERTNAEGRMNSEGEQSEENIKQEVKPENHLNIKVRDTVRGISRRRVVI